MQGPLFAALEPVLGRLSWPPGRWPALSDYQALLDGLPSPPASGNGVPLRVVPPLAGHEGQAAYEERINLRGELPTRPENWHDLFNLLAWVVFPRTKAAINRRHRQCPAAAGGMRSPVQDALTQFDETGVLVACADHELADLMAGFRWKELFWHRRTQVLDRMAVYLLGHGLMEKALHPYTGMTGKAVVIRVERDFMARATGERLAMLDEAAADAVARLERPADLQPLPVLGFPGFTPANAAEAYYDDARYFRPGRRSRG